MDVLEAMDAAGHEQVVWCRDEASGLRAVIALHSTALGPGLGGVRFRPYRDEAEALHDVLRLSRGMTYKNAAAGLDLGGGKAVILGDPTVLRSDALLEAYGRFVDGLAGRYLTAEDVGTTMDDMAVIRRVTPFVTGTDPAFGGSGDPSPATAVGVLHAIEATAGAVWGRTDLADLRVVIAGVGKVGGALAGHLAAAGARLTVADVDTERARAVAAATGASVVAPEEAHRTPCDVFSPCALGGVLSAVTIPQLRCAAVVGSANNQLATPEDAARLAEAGIVYVPDFVASAGGVINIAEELRPEGYDADRALRAVAAIGRTTATVLRVASDARITPEAAATQLAARRLATAAQ